MLTYDDIKDLKFDDILTSLFRDIYNNPSEYDFSFYSRYLEYSSIFQKHKLKNQQLLLDSDLIQKQLSVELLFVTKCDFFPRIYFLNKGILCNDIDYDYIYKFNEDKLLRVIPNIDKLPNIDDLYIIETGTHIFFAKPLKKKLKSRYTYFIYLKIGKLRKK